MIIFFGGGGGRPYFHLMSILMVALAYRVFSIPQINSCFPLLFSSIPVSIGLEQQCDSCTLF